MSNDQAHLLLLVAVLTGLAGALVGPAPIAAFGIYLLVAKIRARGRLP